MRDTSSNPATSEAVGAPIADSAPTPLLSPIVRNIPAQLTARPQWVVWVAVWKPDAAKWSKEPYDANTHNGVWAARASSTDPATWSTFDVAVAAYATSVAAAGPEERIRFAGVGYVLSPSDDFTGIDLDGCIRPDHSLSSDALGQVDALATYTEISPSGTGLRMFVIGTLPPGGRRRGPVEMYDSGRFLTITGRRWPGTSAEVEARQVELEALHASIFPPVTPSTTAAERISPLPGDLPATDEDLLQIAYRASNGGNIRALYSGVMSAYNGDHSAADLALCTQLAFYTGDDAVRLDRLFRSSALMRRKWDEGHYSNGDTYGSRTVRAAIDGCREFYSPPGSATAKLKSAQKRDGMRKEKQERRERRTEETKNAGGLPLIETNDRHLRDVSGDALQALIAANEPPSIFVRSGRLVRIETNEKDVASIGEMREAPLRHHLARVANFVSTSDDRGTVPVAPGPTMINDLLAFPKFDFVPPLETIVTAPVVAPDGSLLTDVGYLPAARVYYDSVDRRPIPDSSPTPEAVEGAKELLLRTLLADFPFADDAARCHALALLLLPFVRPLIQGNTPLHVIDAPTQGTGKTLLGQVASSIFLGRYPAGLRCPERRDDEEWRKIITSQLQSGASHILFDNLKQRLDSASLAIALTSAEWVDRQLGSNMLTITLPVRCTWILTGNNIELDGDFPRRSVWIRLDSEVERPEERSPDGFKIPDIDHYTVDQRPRLMAAALTLVRAWLDAGRPLWSGKPVGGYTSWCRIMGGILDTIGVPGFLTNREELYERADPERERWGNFVEAWHEKYLGRAVGVSELIDIAIDCEIVGDDSRGSKNVFGRLLRGREGAIFAGFAITKAGSAHRAAQYSVNQTKQCELFTPLRDVSENTGVTKNQTPYVGVGMIHNDSFDSPINEIDHEEEKGEEF